MSILQMGDYDLTETVDIPFHTFDSNDPTESITISDLAAGDIEIHKDGSDTQRASDDGVTVTIDFDGITGNHMLHIDLSDNDDADYYANGSRYSVRIEGCTVDAGNPVNAWIGVFSIGLNTIQTNAALVALKLDHLVAVADSDDPVDDSIMAKIAASDGDWSNFTEATDALQSLAASLANIANVGAAVNTPAASFTLTDGNQVANTYEATAPLDGVYHQIDDEDGSTGDIDCYYEFAIGGDGSPTSVTITGRINSVGNNHDVFAYNWGTPGWDQIGTFASKAQSVDDVNTYTLFTSHVGTAGDLGKVRIQLVGTGLSGPDIYIDQIFVSYAIVARSVGYQDGAVWLDTVNGVEGTESFVNGTADNPSKLIAEALTIMGNMKLTTLHVLPGSAVTLGAAFEDKLMVGAQYTLDLSGESISGSKIEGCIAVIGTMVAVADRPAFVFCGIGNVTIDPMDMFECGFFGTVTLGSEGTFTFGACAATLPHGTDAVIDYGAGLDASDITMQSWGGGGIEAQNAGAGAGTYSLSIHGWGELTINANCSDDFDIDTHGAFAFTNNSAVTSVTSDTNYEEASDIAAILVDTDATIPGLIGGLNDIAAADVWSEGSARTEDYGLLLERLAEWHFNEKTVTDATGAVVLRDQGDSNDLADWGITDNATLTVSTEVVWV